MDLHSGLPYWLIKNGLLADYPTLDKNLPKEEVVIIGSGITGALVAHELCSAGIKCTIIDKRLLSSGSTWASTAHLNYELDTPLYKLIDMYGESMATKAYQASYEAVGRVQKILKELKIEADVSTKPSLYLASDKKGAKANEKEYEARTKAGFKVDVLSNTKLKREYKIDRPNALYHTHAAQMDAYRSSVGIIDYHVKNSGLKVFTRTHIKQIEPVKTGVKLETDTGLKINAKYVVCAAGYEAAEFLPKKVSEFNSTYALITSPIDPKLLWKDKALIWETARPYFYLRTTADNRIIIGGEDIRNKNAKVRDRQMDKKEQKLMKQFAELFPHIPAVSEFTWCGTFSESKDGMPFIGEYPGIKNIFFALGYGGNGITFSTIAAQVIANAIQGKKDELLKVFSFER